MCIIAPQETSVPESSLAPSTIMNATPTEDCSDTESQMDSMRDLFKPEKRTQLLFPERVEMATTVISRKKISTMSNSRKLNEKLDNTLAYLIHVLGFNNLLHPMIHNSEVFMEVSYLLNLLKIRLMTQTELTDEDTSSSENNNEPFPDFDNFDNENKTAESNSTSTATTSTSSDQRRNIQCICLIIYPQRHIRL